jgi:hypothetical protein
VHRAAVRLDRERIARNRRELGQYLDDIRRGSVTASTEHIDKVQIR